MKNKCINKMRLEIDSIGQNESFARGAVAMFASQIDPTLDEINDIKTAVSEAVTNCVVHAYGTQRAPQGSGAKAKGSFSAKAEAKAAVAGKIIIECELFADAISIKIADNGIGIANIEKALEPFYTTRPQDERSGMGFTVMQSFMDSLKVTSDQNGTVVHMQKFFRRAGEQRANA